MSTQQLVNKIRSTSSPLSICATIASGNIKILDCDKSLKKYLRRLSEAQITLLIPDLANSFH